MKTRSIVIVWGVAFLMLIVASCRNNNPYAEYQKMDNGVHIKYHHRGDEGPSPTINDVVVVDMALWFDDSLLFNTSLDAEPLEFLMQEPVFYGDMFSALLLMRVGDSVSIIFPSDSLSDISEKDKGKFFTYDISLKRIVTAEEIDAQYIQWIDDLQQKEQDLLAKYRDSGLYRIEDNGLIILQWDRTIGRQVTLGELVNFDLVLTELEGDTIIDSHQFEPIEAEHGEGFLSPGFDEVLGVMRVGERMKFIMPSAIAFDSVGYQEIILPYTALYADVRINSVLNREEYAALEQQKAEQQRIKYAAMLEEQRKELVQYALDNGFDVEPSASGLYYKEMKAGQGVMTKENDSISMFYSIYNLKGELVDSNVDLGLPLIFKMGQDEMLPGIEEGLLLMRKGGSAKMLMPSDIAFGELTIDENLLPANTPVVVEIELVDIIR